MRGRPAYIRPIGHESYSELVYYSISISKDRACGAGGTDIPIAWFLRFMHFRHFYDL